MLHETIQTEAIVLVEKELGDDDKLFFLYTKEFGKVEVLGKAIRKSKAKLRGGLQQLNYILIEFVKGKTFNIATDAIIKKEFLEIKKNPKIFRQAIYLGNLLHSLTEPNEKDQRMWDLISDTLNDLENILENHYWLFARYFEWNLMAFLGFEPELYKCLSCEEKIKHGKFFFSAKRGGVLCKKCLEKRRNLPQEISRDAIKILRLIIHQDKKILKRLKITKEQEIELKKLSQYYITRTIQEEVFII